MPVGGADYRPVGVRGRVNSARIGWALCALVLATCFASLGNWQLGRARDKEALTEAVERAYNAVPIALAALSAQRPERPLRLVARGRFDATREVLLDNQAESGRAGVRVLTPFRSEGDPPAGLLVDRGWLPIDATTRKPARVAAPPAGLVEIRGLLTALPGVGVRMGEASIDPGSSRPLLNYLDQAALDAAFGPGLVAGLLRLDADLAGGFLRNYQPVPAAMPPARHRGYAFQWFALAVTVILTWLLLAFRRP